jgi:hypothetical protein
MKLSSVQVEPIERLTELALKVILFFFILSGTATLTGFFVYCVVNDKSSQAKLITGYGDVVFFTAFGKLVWNYFVRDARSNSVVVPAIAAGSAGAEDVNEED